jgi:hypothetical protein
MTKYDEHWKEAVYYITPNETKIKDYLPIFEYSYRKLTGIE